MPIGRSLVALFLLAVPSAASASTFSLGGVCTPTAADQPARPNVERVWDVRFDAGPAAAPRLAIDAPLLFASEDAQGSPRPKAIEYSHGYEVRRKIHVYASIATLPLFVTEIALGQQLYNGNGSDGQRTAHAVVAGSIAALFGVNTVTGVWNLWEARSDPAHRGRRMTHGIMMLAADAGFVATGMLAPSREDVDYLDHQSTHRAVALTSMGVATASYLMMLFWK